MFFNRGSLHEAMKKEDAVVNEVNHEVGRVFKDDADLLHAKQTILEQKARPQVTQTPWKARPQVPPPPPWKARPQVPPAGEPTQPPFPPPHMTKPNTTMPKKRKFADDDVNDADADDAGDVDAKRRKYELLTMVGSRRKMEAPIDPPGTLISKFLTIGRKKSITEETLQEIDTQGKFPLEHYMFAGGDGGGDGNDDGDGAGNSNDGGDDAGAAAGAGDGAGAADDTLVMKTHTILTSMIDDEDAIAVGESPKFESASSHEVAEMEDILGTQETVDENCAWAASMDDYGMDSQQD